MGPIYSCAHFSPEHPLFDLHLSDDGTATHPTTAAAVPPASRAIRGSRGRRQDLLLGTAHRVGHRCRMAHLPLGWMDLLCNLVEPCWFPGRRASSVWSAVCQSFRAVPAHFCEYSWSRSDTADPFQRVKCWQRSRRMGLSHRYSFLFSSPL